MSGLPSWAVAVKYEYDLGAVQHCNHCMGQFREGQTVYQDANETDAYYCSQRCVVAAGAPEMLCDWCGEASDMLTEVDDSDPSVGYYSTLNICPACQTRRRVGAPIRVAAPDDDDEPEWTNLGYTPYEEQVEGQDAGLRPKQEVDHE